MAKKKIPSSFDAGSSNANDLLRSKSATLAAPGSGDAGLQADEDNFYAENPEYTRQSPEGDGFKKRESLEEGSQQSQEDTDNLLAQQERDRLEREAGKQISQNAMLDADDETLSFKKRENDQVQIEADGVQIVETEQEREDKARETHSKEYDKQEFLDANPEQAFTDSQGKRHLIHPDFSKSNFDYQFALGNVDEGQEEAYKQWKATGEVNPLLLGMEVEQEQFEFEQKRNAQIPDYAQGNSLLEGIHNTFNVAFPTAIKGSKIALQGLSTQEDGKELDRLKLGLEDGTYEPGTEVIAHKRTGTSRPGGGKVKLIPIEDRIKFLERKRKKTNAHILDGIGDLKELEKAAEGYNNPEIFDEDGLTVKDFGGIVGRQVPQMLVSMTTFGLGAFGQEFGSAYADNLKAIAAKKHGLNLEEGEEPTKEQMLAVIDAGEDELGVALATGAISGGLEFVGAKGAGNLLIKNGFFKNAVKKNAVRVLKSRGLAFTGDTLGEALTEASQSIVSQYGSHKALKKEEDFQLDWAEIKESAGQGLIGGVGLSGPRHAYGASKSRFRKEAGKLQGEINRAIDKKDGTKREITDADVDAMTPDSVEGTIKRKQDSINQAEEALQDAGKRGDIESQQIIQEQVKEDVAARAVVEADNKTVISQMSDAELESQLSSADQISNLNEAAERANTDTEKKVINRKLADEQSKLKHNYDEVKNWDTNVETANFKSQAFDTKNDEHRQTIKDLKAKEFKDGSKEARKVKEIEKKIKANEAQQEEMWGQFETQRPNSVEGSIVRATNSKNPTKANINKIKAHMKSPKKNRGDVKKLADKITDGDFTKLDGETRASLESIADPNIDLIDSQVGGIVSNGTKNVKGDLNSRIKVHNDTRSAFTAAVGSLRQIVSGAAVQADGKKIKKDDGRTIASTIITLGKADAILETDAQGSLDAIINGNDASQWSKVHNNPEMLDAMNDVKNALGEIAPGVFDKTIAAIEKIQQKQNDDVLVKVERRLQGERIILNEREAKIAEEFTTVVDDATGQLKVIPKAKATPKGRLTAEPNFSKVFLEGSSSIGGTWMQLLNNKEVRKALESAGYTDASIQEITRTFNLVEDGRVGITKNKATKVHSNNEQIAEAVHAFDNLTGILDAANKFTGLGKNEVRVITDLHQRANQLSKDLDALILEDNRRLGQAKLELAYENEAIGFGGGTTQTDGIFDEEGDYNADFETGGQLEEGLSLVEETNPTIERLENVIQEIEIRLDKKAKQTNKLINDFVNPKNLVKQLSISASSYTTQINELETEQRENPVEGRDYTREIGRLKGKRGLIIDAAKKGKTTDKTAKTTEDVFEDGILQETVAEDKAKVNKWVQEGNLYKFFEQDLENGIVDRDGQFVVKKEYKKNRFGIKVSRDTYEFIPTSEARQTDGIAKKLKKEKEETWEEFDARKAARVLEEGKVAPELTQEVLDGKDNTLKVLQLLGIAKKEAQKAIHNRSVQPTAGQNELVLAPSDFYSAAYDALTSVVMRNEDFHGKPLGDLDTVKKMTSAVRNEIHDAVNDFADRMKDIRPPAKVKKLKQIIFKAKDFFQGKTGRAPSLQELEILINHRFPTDKSGRRMRKDGNGKLLKNGSYGQGNVNYRFPGYENSNDPYFSKDGPGTLSSRKIDDGGKEITFDKASADQFIENLNALADTKIKWAENGQYPLIVKTSKEGVQYLTGPIIQAENYAKNVNSPSRLDGMVEFDDGEIASLSETLNLDNVREGAHHLADFEIQVEKIREGKQDSVDIVGEQDYAMLTDKVAKILRGLPIIPSVVIDGEQKVQFQPQADGKRESISAFPSELASLKKVFAINEHISKDIKEEVIALLNKKGIKTTQELHTFEANIAKLRGIPQDLDPITGKAIKPVKTKGPRKGADKAFTKLVEKIAADVELAAIYTGKVRDIPDVFYGHPVVNGEVQAAKEFWDNSETVAYESDTGKTIKENLETIRKNLGVKAETKAIKEGTTTIKAHKKGTKPGKTFVVNENTQQFTELKEGKDKGIQKVAKDIEIKAHRAPDTKKLIKTLQDQINKDLKLREFEFRPGFGPQKVLKTEGKKRLSNIDNKTREQIGKIKEVMLTVKSPTPEFLMQVQSAINATMREGYARQTAKHKSLKAENEALAAEGDRLFTEDLSTEYRDGSPTDVKLARAERTVIDKMVGKPGQVSGQGIYAKIANFITSPQWDHHYGLLERILPTQAGPLREAAKKFLNDNYTEELKMAMYQSQEEESSLKEDYDNLLVKHWGERKSTAQKLGVDKGALGSEALVFKGKSATGRTYLTKGSGVFIGNNELSNSQVVALVNYAKDPTLHSKLVAGKVSLEKVGEMIDYLNSEGQEQLKRFSGEYPTLFSSRRAKIDAKLDAEGVKGVEGDTYIRVEGNQAAYLSAKEKDPNVREFTPDQASLDLLYKVYDGKIPTKSIYTPFKGAQTEASVDLDFDVFASGQLDAASVIAENLSARSETGAVDWLGLSIEDSVNNYATGTMRSISFLKFSRKAAQIFNKKNLRKLEISQGKDWVDAYKKQIKHLITGRRPQAFGDAHPGLKWIDRWLSRGTALIMAVNPKSAILQTTSATNFIVEDPSIINNKDNFFGKDFTEAMEIIKNSGFYKLRGATNTDVMIDQIGNQQGYSGTKTIDNWLQKGLFLTKFADKGAIAKGGAPYVANQLRKARAQSKQEGNKFSGKSEAEITAEIMKDFQLLARQSQQDSSADNLGALQTTPFGKYTGSFMNATAQYMRNISSALRKIQAGEDVAHNSFRVFNYGVFAPLAFAAMSGAMANALSFNDDDEEDSEDDKIKRQRYWVGLLDTFMTSMGPWRALVFNFGSSMVAAHDEGYNRDGTKKSDKQKKARVSAFLNEFSNLVPMVSHRLRMMRIATGEKRTYSQSQENLGWLSEITGESPADLRRLLAGVEGSTPIPTWRLYSWISAIEDQFADDLDLLDKAQRIGGFSRYALQQTLPSPGKGNVRNTKDGFSKRAGSGEDGFKKRGGNDGFKKRGSSSNDGFSKRGATDKDDGFSDALPFNRGVETRAPLQAGVSGEAHKDGTIVLAPGMSQGEKAKTIAHEGKHQEDMKSGKLGYTEKAVQWEGKDYPRKNGKIKFNGRWLKEGHRQFPWEKVAYKAEANPKKSKSLNELYNNKK